MGGHIFGVWVALYIRSIIERAWVYASLEEKRRGDKLSLKIFKNKCYISIG